MRGAPAFTLLEMVVVLVIITLLVGVGVMSFDGLLREQEMRRPVSELKRMTQEAVRRAVQHERPQVIVFDGNGFSTRGEKAPQAANGSHQAPPLVDHARLPDGMTLVLRRFGAAKFTAAGGQRLMVTPGGLCEPLTARFEQGHSWIEVTLDPLTGGVAEESMVIE